ncbi:unnamed protein product [Choristocarpus tenellus]
MVRDVKSKITEEKGVDPASQRLFCTGKALEDSKPLATYLSEGAFLVLMVTKAIKPHHLQAKPRPPAASSSTQSQRSASPAQAPVPVEAGTSAGVEQITQPPAPAPARTGAIEREGGVTPDQALVTQIMAMGFPEDQVRAALVAAFNNISVATEYLMMGIPDHVDHFQTIDTAGGGGSIGIEGGLDSGSATHPSQTPSAPGRAVGEPPGAPERQHNHLNFMRFHPQFAQIRQLVQENPNVLPNILQQLGQQSTDLVQMINDHPDDFVRLMNEPLEEEDIAMGELHTDGQSEIFLEGFEDGEEGDLEDEGDEGGDEEAEGGLPAQGGAVMVELTTAEAEDVENLMAMVPSATRDQVLEAYMACDKNAELAVNLLFEATL